MLNRSFGFVLSFVMGAFAFTGSLQATEKNTNLTGSSRPPVFEALVACKLIANPEERLACYDAKVTAIDEAEKKDEIVMADKESMKDARRGLFGFNIPKIKIFGNSDENEIKELVTTIKSARRDGDGKWVLTLADGARWQQTDSGNPIREPKSGMEIKIRPAALGSYFVNIGGQRAIRMKRLN